MAEDYGPDINVNYLATVVHRLTRDVEAFEVEGLHREGPSEFVRNRRLADWLWVVAGTLSVPVVVLLGVQWGTAVPPLDTAVRLMAALLAVTALLWIAVARRLVRQAFGAYPRQTRVEVQPAFVESLTNQIMKAARAAATPPRQER
jgi:hypothetical protein